jgi:hypothetical protein
MASETKFGSIHESKLPDEEVQVAGDSDRESGNEATKQNHTPWWRGGNLSEEQKLVRRLDFFIL